MGKSESVKDENRSHADYQGGIGISYENPPFQDKVQMSSITVYNS